MKSTINSTQKTLSKLESLELTLEILQQSSQYHKNLLFILNLLPYGPSIINVSTNFKKLNYLKSNILPRRKTTLLELQNDSTIPKNIKNTIIINQIKLIKKTTNEIIKRTSYHNKTLKYLNSLT